MMLKKEVNVSIKTDKQDTLLDLRLSKKIIHNVIEPIETWTTHGLPNIVRSKYISVKIVWSLLFLTAVGTSIYFLDKTIKEFFEYNVTTKVRLINVNELDYPVITVCDKHQISTDSGLNYFIQNYLNNFDAKNVEILAELYHILNFDIFPYQLLYDVPILKRSNFTQSIENMLYKGTLNNHKITASDFEWIFNPYYGNCYQLNTDSKFKAIIQNTNLLELTFVSKHPDRLKNKSMENKINVILSPSNSNPFLNFNDVIEAPGGLLTKIKLEKSVFNKYPQPYSDCNIVEDENGNLIYPTKFQKKYFNQIQNAGYKYSQSLCISFCQLDILGSNCSFRPSSIKAPNNLDNFCPAESKQFKNNLDPAYTFLDPAYWSVLESHTHELYKKMFEDKVTIEKCENVCPLECYKENFQIASSTFELDEHPQDQNLTVSSLVGLTINFRSLSYLNYEETPTVSIFNLLSNIGGVIGLLLGIFLIYKKDEFKL
jgi:hypothetical protein